MNKIYYYEDHIFLFYEMNLNVYIHNGNKLKTTSDIQRS